MNHVSSPETKHTSRIIPVALSRLTVSPAVQRDLRKYRIDELLADFDLEMFGMPVVSHREGKFYIIDGHHRITTLKQWLGAGWEDQKIECRVFEGMSEREEARMFDRLNNTLRVNAIDRFMTRLTAGEQVELAIQAALHKEGFSIARKPAPGVVSSVGTLLSIYKRSGPEILRQALRITSRAYGDSGLETSVIDGIARLCQRYSGSLNEAESIEKLASARGGVSGLLSQATVLRKQTGNNLPICIAASAVEIINKGRGGKKLPSWWAMQG